MKTLGEIRSIDSRADENRQVEFTLSTGSKDRHNTILNQDNWKLDNYRKNPVVFWSHEVAGGLFTAPNPDNLIGKSLKVWVEGSGSSKELVARMQFEDPEINPLAEKIFRKVLFGSLSMASVGFLEIGKGKLSADKETYYFEGQELLEWSIVGIPSNPEAGKRSRSLESMAKENAAPLSYAVRNLANIGALPSKIGRLTPAEVLILLEGQDMGIFEEDPQRVKKIITDKRIEAERADFLYRRNIQIEIERQLFREGKLHNDIN